MSSTVCTCLRVGVLLLLSDPDCPAPSHLWDAVEETDD